MDSLIRFDAPAEAAQTSGTPAPAALRTRGGLRRLATAGLLALTLVAGAAGGGVIGAFATMRWLASESAPPPPSTTTSQLIQQPVSPLSPPSAGNVAGEVYARVNPSIVQVVVAGRTARGSMAAGSGSGFVIDERGYILTNYHVIEGARSVSVRFNTGATREAEVVGTDSGNDLALLRVDLPEGVPAASLGDSDQVQVGETAIAIGSPFGLEESVTQGIISATNRTWAPSDGRVRRNLLQTDAPINPGNSGGPLLNARGEVIGITSMIESPVAGNVGIGFAVPVNTAKRLLPRLEAGASLEPVWLGIAGRAVDPAVARDQGLPVQEGVLVLSVAAGGPAERAGLRGGQGGDAERIPSGGDVIVALEGTPVNDIDQLSEALAGLSPGDRVDLIIIRGGERQQVQVTLQAWPSQTP